MELRNVNTFLRVAEQRSFSRAASLIGYSQSTVTTQIHSLEDELGVQLFDRINKTVRLTPQGEEFLQYAQTLIRTAAEAKSALTRMPQMSGPLHLAMAESVCTTFFPRILALYHQRYPAVELRVSTAGTAELLRILQHNEVDLVYTFDHRTYKADQVIVLEHEEAVRFVAAPGGPLSGRELTLQEVAAQPLLLTERGMSYRGHLDEAMAAGSIELHPFLELGKVEMLRKLVEDGAGVSFLPDYAIRESVSAGRLEILNVPECRITEWRQLIRHRDKWMTPQMQAMVEILKEMCPVPAPLVW